MQAYTGSGKTGATIVPFIIVKKKGLYFTSKLIYSLPLKILANPLYEDVKESINKYDPDIKVTIQFQFTIFRIGIF